MKPRQMAARGLSTNEVRASTNSKAVSIIAKRRFTAKRFRHKRGAYIAGIGWRGDDPDYTAKAGNQNLCLVVDFFHDGCQIVIQGTCQHSG